MDACFPREPESRPACQTGKLYLRCCRLGAVQAYVIRRILLLIPTFIILTMLVFLSVRLIPGNVVDATMAKLEFDMQEIDREQVERMLGLDKPIYVQYATWVGDLVLKGTLGNSFIGAFTVEERIAGRFRVTLELGLISIFIALIIAIPVGIYSAVRQDAAGDYVGRSVAVLGLATPNFWLATIVLIYPAIWWAWAPPTDLVYFLDNPLQNIWLYTIPGLILGTAMSAGTMRMMRTMMLEVLRQDYIRTAWSKGLRERMIILRHVIRNALIPVVTLIGMQVPIIIGGSVIIENLFALPGLGRLAVNALIDRDYPVVSGINLIFASLVMGLNLVVDILYAFLDPRVQHGQ